MVAMFRKMKRRKLLSLFRSNAVRLLMRTRHVNGLLIAAILVISTAPLYARRQQQNVAKLKAASFATNQLAADPATITPVSRSFNAR
jgi:hypothetical protein